jgi:hypothetical protein
MASNESLDSKGSSQESLTMADTKESAKNEGWLELIRQLATTVTDPARTSFLQEMELSVRKSSSKL